MHDVRDMDKVGVGVIGVGAWGKNHARVFYELPNAELIAVCDKNPERAKEIASRYDVEYYTDPIDLLRQKSIDAISIVTPTTTHYRMVTKALKFSKKVFVEKPISDTVAEAKDIVRLIKKEDHFVMVGFISRFDPSLSIVKELIDSGKIGNIVLLYAARVGPFWPERVGDVGVVKDVALHDIDLFRYLTEMNPVTVYGIVGSLRHKYEDHASIILKFKGDLTALIESNWITPYKKRHIYITGSEGMATVNILTQEVLLEKEQWIMRSKTLWREPLKIELDSFITAIRKGEQPPVTVVDGLIALIIAEAALESAKTGMPVDVHKRIEKELKDAH